MLCCATHAHAVSEPNKDALLLIRGSSVTRGLYITLMTVAYFVGKAIYQIP